MTSIDELFKKSGLPSKRKLEPLKDPNEIYKSAKLGSNGSSSRHRQAHIEDEADDDDLEAGPAPPPEDDEDGDYGPAMPPPDDEPEDGDDEDGRFFGGGISKQEKEILDYMDTQKLDDPNAAPETIDLSWLKKTALAFEKRITKNAELRARHEDEPAKFIDSEADLDAGIKTLSILSEHPELYGEFAKLGCVGSLVSLLAHENTDIAIDAVEIIGELTDEDVPATTDQWNTLVDALLEADLLGLLVSNFSRLDEENQEADRSGVYHALGVIENLCSRPKTAEDIGKDEDLLKWLLSRAKKAEKPVTQNKQYAAEILAILVQSSPANRRRLANLDAVDTMLQLVAPYRIRDPEKGGDEEEYMENLFEALACIADEPLGKTKFIDAEGVELCLIMLKDGKLSKLSALRLLDHAASRASLASSSSTTTPNPIESSTQVATKLVDAGGLKTLFTLFMKSTSSSSNPSKTKSRPEITEHLLSIFSSLLRHLPAESPERIRTLAKFVEKDYEKTARLVSLRREYASRLSFIDAQIAQEKTNLTGQEDEEEMEMLNDEWFSRRLDGGLFNLQMIDLLLAWLVAEDDGARGKIKELLGDRDEDLGVIRKTLEEQMKGIEADAEDEGAKDTREMLRTLVEFL
ncbi:putative DUF1716 domain-protein [Rhypophila decipiens]|uniref:DUF1716 domain-protein n=1 Tax=Rhypophila decipiens TaxID=261697 RepID=A0AAN7B8F6_9PEZI|nr:putative DUF1716 domain-protein [Rhypophila decipiens]